MAAPLGTFRPAQTPLADSTANEIALQIRMYLGELVGAFNVQRQISPLLDSKTIEAGLSWQSPAYGHMSEGKYHLEGESVITDTGYLHRVPLTDKSYFIDKPFTVNGLVPDFYEFQTHYETREVWMKQAAEKHVKVNDMKAARRLIQAARSAANVPVGGDVTADMATPPGASVIGNVATTPAALSSATMLTSGATLLTGLQAVAQLAMEREIPDGQLIALLHPAQYFNLINNRELLDRDVMAVPGTNGDFPNAKVYMAYGITLKPSTAIKRVRDFSGAYGGTTGENASASYAADYSKNAGIVFTRDAVLRLVRKDMEMQMWYEKPRFAHLTTSRIIDGYGVKRPECAFELSTP